MSQQQETLDKIRVALLQPNKALRKRALALIHNQSIVEARPLIEQYLGTETDPEMLPLAQRVLGALDAFTQASKGVKTDQLGDLLTSADPSQRLVALRALASRQEPGLAETLHRAGALNESDPECLQLVLEAFALNPHPANLPLQLAATKHVSDKIRQLALQGLMTFINGAILPRLLEGLLDPAPQMKMKAYQLVNSISRVNLLASLDAMLAQPAGDALLCARLLPSFLNRDLLPILQKGIKHAHPEVKALSQRALVLLSQKGDPEAAALLEDIARAAIAAKTAAVPPAARTAVAAMPAAPAPAPAVPAVPGISATPAAPAGAIPLRSKADTDSILARWPTWLTLTLRKAFGEQNPRHACTLFNTWVNQLREFFALSWVVVYFTQGRSHAGADRLAFGVMQYGVSRVDPVKLVQHSVHLLPACRREDELFPRVFAEQGRKDDEEAPFISLFVEMLEGLKLLQAHPDRAVELNAVARETAVRLLATLEPMLANRVVVRINTGTAFRAVDLNAPSPAALDARVAQNAAFTPRHPYLCSRDLNDSVPLHPFSGIDEAGTGLVKRQPNEDELWEFLTRHQALDGFFAFLKEKPPTADGT